MSKKYCSFCGRDEDQVKHLISGPDVFICNICIKNSEEILNYEDEEEKLNFLNEMKLLKPKQLKKELDKYIIGQDRAKKTLSVAVYNHYKRLLVQVEDKDNIEINKSNVLLIGPTGTGKTLLAKTLASILRLPFAIADATSLTEAGYVGDDVETILTRLIDSAEGNLESAEKGIIYIDEIDKIAKKSKNQSITRDVSGEGVQQALLKIIEGTEASVPLTLGRKNPNQEQVKINTENILFIVGGAFSGIEQIVEDKYKQKAIGFNQKNSIQQEFNEELLYQNLTANDVIEYGLIPEFVGRLNNIATLDKLTIKDLETILKKPKNALVKQYIKMFELDNVKLTFKPGAVKKLAEVAIDKGIGARGLNSIVDKLMNDLMFEVPSSKDIEEIVITSKSISGEESPEIIKKSKVSKLNSSQKIIKKKQMIKHAVKD